MNSNNRNVVNYLEEYHEIIAEKQDKGEILYADEVAELHDLSDGEMFHCMYNSYKFGFIAGLEYAKNQNKA